jgi:hypothetical protein
MKRKTLPNGKKESQDMQMGTTSETGLPGPNCKAKAEITDAEEKRNRIEELRKKIEEGYYNGTDIINKIVSKLLKDI